MLAVVMLGQLRIQGGFLPLHFLPALSTHHMPSCSSCTSPIFLLGHRAFNSLIHMILKHCITRASHAHTNYNAAAACLVALKSSRTTSSSSPLPLPLPFPFLRPVKTSAQLPPSHQFCTGEHAVMFRSKSSYIHRT